jgi:subtilisin-like proprotein convertase family protein
MKKVKETNQVLLVISDTGNPKMGRFGHNWGIDCPFLSDANKEMKDEFAKKQLELYKDFTEGRVSYYYHEK